MNSVCVLLLFFIFSVDMNLVADVEDNLKHHKEAPQSAANRDKSNAAVSW